MTSTLDRKFGQRASLPVPRRGGWGKGFAGRQRPVYIKKPAGSTPEAPANLGDQRLAGLDLLRLVAALAVVAFHFGYAGAARGTMQTSFPFVADAAKYGFLGVDLFFLISGYVITATAYGRSWQQFAVARFLRLYPAHLVCMCTTAVVLVGLGTSAHGVSGAKFLANLTMIAPAFGQPFMDGVYWSIVIEMIFYGWVAILIAAGIFERRLLTILTIWLAIAFFNEAYLQSRALRLGMCTEYAAMFAAGIIIQRIRAGETNPYAWTVLGYAFGLGFLHAFENERIFARLYGDAVSLPLMWFLHAGIIALFAAALWLSRWLRPSPTLLAVGGITYPLYLVHQQAGAAIIDRLAPVFGGWQAVLIALALILAFSYAVWRWAEPAGRRRLASLFVRRQSLLQRARSVTAPRSRTAA